MRYCLFLCCLFILQSCGLNEREKKLKQALKENARKEQQLLKWEQQLKVRENQLEQAKMTVDSVNGHADSAGVINPALKGKWTVKMTCTETTCEGSALGDSKTEQWVISYKQNTVLVKAYSGPVLTRVYIGSFEDEVLKVTDENPNTSSAIGVSLSFKSERRMEGKREIQQKDCKIIYSLDAERAK